MCFSPATFYYLISGRDPQLRLPDFFFSLSHDFSSGALGILLLFFCTCSWKIRGSERVMKELEMFKILSQDSETLVLAVISDCWPIVEVADCSVLKIKCFSFLCVPFAAKTFPSVWAGSFHCKSYNMSRTGWKDSFCFESWRNSSIFGRARQGHLPQRFPEYQGSSVCFRRYSMRETNVAVLWFERDAAVLSGSRVSKPYWVGWKCQSMFVKDVCLQQRNKCTDSWGHWFGGFFLLLLR